MRILGIESSCDDTSVALLDASENSFEILTEKTASQIDVHKKYGGVVPEIAGRKHAEAIIPLIEKVLTTTLNPSPTKGGTRVRLPDVIAVTAGPGLITGLLVGVEAAKTLSYLWNVPLIAVNHIDGHVHSVEIENQKSKIKNQKLDNHTLDSKFLILNSHIQFPALCLIVSGGHTELLLSTEHNSYSLIGKTRDDAAGECFDKVAKLLGLEYPGGPKISKMAEEGNPNAIDFPRPMIDSDDFYFSFSGLKTAALYWLRDHNKKTSNFELETSELNDFCASFEQAIVDVLVAKTMRAAKKCEPKTIILAGGVASNNKLRETLNKKILISNFQFPISKYCMDNAVMIAIAGYYKAIRNEFTPWQKLEVDPNWHAFTGTPTN